MGVTTAERAYCFSGGVVVSTAAGLESAAFSGVAIFGAAGTTFFSLQGLLLQVEEHDSGKQHRNDERLRSYKQGQGPCEKLKRTLDEVFGKGFHGYYRETFKGISWLKPGDFSMLGRARNPWTRATTTRLRHATHVLKAQSVYGKNREMRGALLLALRQGQVATAISMRRGTLKVGLTLHAISLPDKVGPVRGHPLRIRGL